METLDFVDFPQSSPLLPSPVLGHAMQSSEKIENNYKCSSWIFSMLNPDFINYFCSRVCLFIFAVNLASNKQASPY